MSISLTIIDGKCHIIKHSFDKKNEYIIVKDNEVYYWRPSLRMIGFEYTSITQAQNILLDIKTKQYRSESVRQELIKHWSNVIQLMRDSVIEKVLQPEVDYNSFILAC